MCIVEYFFYYAQVFLTLSIFNLSTNYIYFIYFVLFQIPTKSQMTYV